MKFEFMDNLQEASYIMRPLWEKQNAKEGVSRSKQEWAFALKGDQGLIGAVSGQLKNDWCYVKELIVDDSCRGKGYAQQLMQKADDFAREQGAVGVFLTTYSYQAPEFYKKCGFEILATFEDMPKGHKKHIMQKVF